MARLDKDAAGRLLEGVSDHAPREMTVRTATSDRTRLTGRSHPHPATEEVPHVSSSPIRQLSLYGACALLMAGCTPSTPSLAPVPEAQPTDSALAVNAEATWTPRRSPGSWHYKFESSATVTLDGDTTARALPVGRTALYTVTLALPDTGRVAGGDSSGSFRVTGHVDSLMVTTAERIPRPTAGTGIRPYFSATLTPTGHLMDVESNSGTKCNEGIDPLTAAAQSFFISLPRGVSIGSSWQDTTSTVTCRGSASFSTTATRHYRVVRDTVWQNESVLLIRGTDTTLIRSQTDSDTTAMIIDGTGTATINLYVDPNTGLLVHSQAESQTILTVITGLSRLP